MRPVGSSNTTNYSTKHLSMPTYFIDKFADEFRKKFVFPER